MAKKKIDFSQMKLLRKMSLNEFSRWLNSFGREMWEQGFQDAVGDDEPGMTETDDNIRCVFNEEELLKCLCSVKGVSERIACNIMDAMMDWYKQYDDEIPPEEP